MPPYFGCEGIGEGGEDGARGDCLPVGMADAVLLQRRVYLMRFPLECAVVAQAEAQRSGILRGRKSAHALRQPFVHDVVRHAVVVQAEDVAEFVDQDGQRVQPAGGIAGIRRAVVSVHGVFFVQQRGGIDEPALPCSVGREGDGVFAVGLRGAPFGQFFKGQADVCQPFRRYAPLPPVGFGGFK